jgi:hypothetical protein
MLLLDEKPRTFHNLECSRLCGGACDCKMATTFTPPRHFTALGDRMYTFDATSRLVSYSVYDDPDEA